MRGGKVPPQIRVRGGLPTLNVGDRCEVAITCLRIYRDCLWVSPDDVRMVAEATIGLNSFASRQTADSKFSHFGGTNEELVTLVESHFGAAKPGYRDGVMLVPVPPEGFFSGVVQVTSETELRVTFESRREGEDAFVSVVALGGEKLPARAVDVVLYRRDVLLEDGPDSVSTEAEWEIVSLNARATEVPEPLTPVAMARNLLGLPGGTSAEYSAREFAEAIMYWSSRAMRG